MNIIKTNPENGNTFVSHTVVEDCVHHSVAEVNSNGLKLKYTCFGYDDTDFGWYHINAGPGRNAQEFSIDNQEILKKYLMTLIEKNEKIVIVEIGVNRNAYDATSTSVFLNNKRDADIYVGIDIEDKSSINNEDKNIYTIRCPSQYIEVIFSRFKELGIEHIDMLMLDGYHSINQVYCEWENYTKLLSKNGIVAMHDTNSHPGPYFLLKSIDTDQYDVYKYLSDVVDWGIGIAVRK